MFSHPDISEWSPSLSCTESYCGDTGGGGQITEELSRHGEELQFMISEFKCRDYFLGWLQKLLKSSSLIKVNEDIS